MTNRLMNGVFAVNKPTGPSSAELIGQLKGFFSASPVFASDVAQQAAHGGSKGSKFRHKRGRAHGPPKAFIKIGHGGTLDPLASGVLVVGVGSGTKKLADYLGNCTKSYRAVALFGCSTTTYDSQGSVVKRTPTDHLTDELIASVLDRFRGEIVQTPPVYSALKMNGKPLYEYARAGEPLPKEIEPRKCKIDSLEVVGGLQWDHEYKFPEVDATAEEKLYAEVLDKMGQGAKESVEPKITEPSERNPVLEIEFSVSSGTYIRSLIHDIGLALGTTASMVSLVRTKQADWVLGENVFEVTDFVDRDQALWEPELRHYLENGPKTELQSLRDKA